MRTFLLRTALAIAVFSMAGTVSLASFAKAETAKDLVIDFQSSALIRQGIYCQDVNSVIAPFLTPKLMTFVEKQEKDVAKLLKFVLALGMREVTFMHTSKDFLLSAELPKGKLEKLGAGELSNESLAEAMGPDAAAVFIEELSRSGTLPEVKKNVQPGVHELDGIFMGVAGQTLLVGSSDLQVEVSRKKLLEGKRIAAMPEKKQQAWYKVDFQVNCASSESVEFSPKTYTQESIYFRTEDGWTQATTSNLAEFLTFAEQQAVVNLPDLPLYGEERPFLSMVYGGGLLEALTMVGVKGEFPPLHTLMAGTPFSAKDIKQFGCFIGGPKAHVFGFPVPGAIALIDTTDELAAMVEELAVGAVPTVWREKTVGGWDRIRVADMVNVEGSPIPMPLVLGRKGGMLMFGLMSHDQLDSPKDGSILQAQVPAGEKICGFMEFDFKGFWGHARALMGKESPLRALAGAARPEIAGNMEAVDSLLETDPPVTRVSQWARNDLSLAEAVFYENKEPTQFWDRFCDILFLAAESGTLEGL